MKCAPNRFPQTIKMAVKHTPGVCAQKVMGTKQQQQKKMETKALDDEVLTEGLPSGDRYLSAPWIQGDFLATSEGHLRPNEGI